MSIATSDSQRVRPVHPWPAAIGAPDVAVSGARAPAGAEGSEGAAQRPVLAGRRHVAGRAESEVGATGPLLSGDGAQATKKRKLLYLV